MSEPAAKALANALLDLRRDIDATLRDAPDTLLANKRHIVNTLKAYTRNIQSLKKGKPFRGWPE